MIILRSRGKRVQGHTQISGLNSRQKVLAVFKELQSMPDRSKLPIIPLYFHYIMLKGPGNSKIFLSLSLLFPPFHTGCGNSLNMQQRNKQNQTNKCQTIFSALPPPSWPTHPCSISPRSDHQTAPYIKLRGTEKNHFHFYSGVFTVQGRCSIMSG